MASIKEKLEIIFGVSGADKFRKEFQEADRTVQKSSKSITTSMQSIAKAAAAYLSVQTAKSIGFAALELVKLSDNFRVVQRSSQRLAQSIGQDSQKILQAVRRGVGGAVSDLEILKQVNQAILLGIPVTAQQMETMAVTATRLGRAVGRDAASALGDLVTGIGRMSPLILDNLGITIKLEEAYKGLGEGATDAQKKIAFFNAVMEKANEASATLGDQMPTVGEKLDQMSAKLKNIGIRIGDALSEPVNLLIERVDRLLVRMSKVEAARARFDGRDLNPFRGASSFGALGAVAEGYFDVSNYASGVRAEDFIRDPEKRRQARMARLTNNTDLDVSPAIRGMGGYKTGGLQIRQSAEEKKQAQAWFNFVAGGMQVDDGMKPQLRDMTKDFKAEFKEIEKAGKDSLGNIPRELENDFQGVFSNVGMGISTIGLGAQGRNVSRMGGFFQGEGSGDGSMQKLNATLGTLVPALGGFMGAVGVFKGIASLLGGTRVTSDFTNTSNEELQNIVNGDLGQYSQLQDLGDEAVNQFKQQASRELNNRGASSGSNAYSVSTSITETQANSILAVLETKRAQDAERNNILNAQLSVQTDMKFLMSINSGNLLTFQG